LAVPSLLNQHHIDERFDSLLCLICTTAETRGKLSKEISPAKENYDLASHTHYASEN
jgi:hypothetical protein